MKPYAGLFNELLSNDKGIMSTKGAAQRQLRAAIRMFFAGEDDLAIHTVASAAYQIISDSKKKRGRDEVGDFYLTSIFYVVRDFHRGTLPKLFTGNPEAMKWIRELAKKSPFTESMQYEDMKCSISEETARKCWQERHKISNFLKHAVGFGLIGLQTYITETASWAGLRKHETFLF